MIRFYKAGLREDGAALYALEIDGKVLRRDLTIDEVVRAINSRDETSLAQEHGTGRDHNGE